MSVSFFQIFLFLLLRFRKIADYPAGSNYAATSGSDAFATYARLMMPLLASAGAVEAGESVRSSTSASTLTPAQQAWIKAEAAANRSARRVATTKRTVGR